MDDRAGLGRSGEQQAAAHLKGLGYRIVTCNYRCPLGELDVIALDGKTIVFVEVKTRSDDRLADPQDAVTPAKRRHMRNTAEFFLRQTQSQGRDWRFDIVAIVAEPGVKPRIVHYPDAFDPSW